MISAPRTIVLVGGTKEFTLATLIAAARRLFADGSARVVCVLGRPTSETLRVSCSRLADEVINCADPDSNRAEQLAHLRETVAAVWCLQERDMGTFIAVSEILGVISAEQARLYERARNKATFKETLRGIAPQLVPSVRRFTPEQFAAHIPDNYPVVAKPANLSGSKHVRVLHSATDLLAYIDDLPAILADYERYDGKPELLLEEYVDGEQYSFNAYINEQGAFQLCPILRVIPAFRVDPESTDTYSAFETTSHELSPDAVDSARAALSTIIETFQLRSITAHFDGCLTERRWKFFEMGLRSGGNRHQLYEEINGMDHRRNDLLIRAGYPVSIPEPLAHATLVQKATKQSGILRSVSVPRIATKTELVSRREIKPFRDIGGVTKPVNQGGAVQVKTIVSGPDAKEVFEHATTLYTDAHFEVDSSHGDDT